jgi:ribosomal protein L11 methyltransferase
LKLGARHVVGVDIDPQAVAASRHKVVLNRCNETEIEFCTVHGAAHANAQNGPWADVVVANILANPLIMLAPILSNATRRTGHIVLSGILLEQAEDVIKIYRQWFDMHIAREDAGWILLTGTRQ